MGLKIYCPSPVLASKKIVIISWLVLRSSFLPRDSSETILLGKLIRHCAIFTREFVLSGILMRYRARLLSYFWLANGTLGVMPNEFAKQKGL